MPKAWSACASRRTSPTARYDRKDSFYRRAKQEGYRSRAVFKLEDLLKSVPRLRPGSRVVELGCWPGGWLQLLVRAVAPGGTVVGVDIAPIEPLDGVTFLELDVTEPDAPERIAEALGGPADLLVSDAAPKLSGIRDVDRGAQEELYEAALRVAERVLRPEASLILKGFPGPEADRLRQTLRARFPSVSELRPEGKRSSSKEFYWVAGARRGGRSPRRPAS
jgi:23S rRNA (uridine2552-2'-O)-methyltransferase